MSDREDAYYMQLQTLRSIGVHSNMTPNEACVQGLAALLDRVEQLERLVYKLEQEKIDD